MSGDETDVREAALNWQKVSDTRREVLVVVAAILLVSLVVFLWMFFSHKRRQRHARHHGDTQSPSWSKTADSQPADEAMTVPRRRKWRRHRREHRPRNPTLAETGGLPPIRQDRPPQPPA
jgi:FtsZ-interacting cell division protein ZipA